MRGAGLPRNIRQAQRLRLALALIGVLLALCSLVWLVAVNREPPRRQLLVTPAAMLFHPPAEAAP